MIEPGTILNERYKLIKTLGEGGMANVYLARDLILDRAVGGALLKKGKQAEPLLSPGQRLGNGAALTGERPEPLLHGAHLFHRLFLDRQALDQPGPLVHERKDQKL